MSGAAPIATSPERPVWTVAEARAYDRRAIEDLGIPGIILMENAARGCACEARAMLEGATHPTVFVCCGPGQNGGDGYAIARHLAGLGWPVRILALGEPPVPSDAGLMRAIAIRLGIPILPIDLLAREAAASPPDLVVDALFGIGLSRPLEGSALAAVRAVNGLATRVLAVDVPSGLDSDAGVPMPECIRADVTSTMVALKRGFLAPEAARWTGRVVVVDVGGPAATFRP